MILIGGASETYRRGMGAFQEERQVLLAAPLCKFAHAIDSVKRIPYYVAEATRNATYGRPGAAYLDMPDDIITGKCDEKDLVQVQKCPDPPRFQAPPENIEAALGMLERAERPLILVGKGMAWANAESEVRSFIEKTQVPFLRSPMGKGVMPDDHPLSVAAARTMALQNADVVFLMGARFNWIFHFGQPPRYAPDVKVIQLDIAPEEIGHNKATDVALVGDGKAIMAQMNAALAGRQGFHPQESPWRQMIGKKAAENAEQIKSQVNDDSAPAGYYRAFKDIAAWMPKNSILSAEGAGTMDIGLTMLPVFSAKACLNAGTYGTMGLGLGQAIAAAIVHPDRPVIHLSGDSAIGFSGMEMETLCRYNLPVKIVVLNNGGIGPGMPEIPENPMFNMKPNSLIYGARYDKVMEAFGGKGFFVEDPKDIRGALDEAMNFRGPALVNIVLSQGSARKPQAFRWHS
jgi:2-hydroxyacyl-CoA lyase 1